MRTMLELVDIYKKYRIGPTRLDILKNLSLQVNEGDLLAIMGASGSGKSTLMHIIGMLDRPDSGTYFLEGWDIGSLADDTIASLRSRTIGFVFQAFHLLPRLSAKDNVALPLIYRGMRERDIQAQALATLRKVSMEERAEHRPGELSGGQQQRVAIARALVGKPKLILADEPTGALDATVGQDIMDLFIRLNQEEGLTVIIITHDIKIAEQCTRVLELHNGCLVPYCFTPASSGI